MAKKSPTPKKDATAQAAPPLPKGERTKKRILLAAAEVIASDGIEHATTREIARKAEVANGLVSHYFPEKDRIFELVIREIAQEAYQSIEAPPESASGEDKLLHMCRANLEFFLANPSFLKCFLLFYYYCSIRKSMREMNTALTARAIQRCEEYLLQYFSERKKSANKEEIGIYARLFHDHLMASIQKFMIVDHATSETEYSRLFLRGIKVFLSRLG